MNLKQYKQYHQKKKQIGNKIVRSTDNSEIIYGAQAVNKQVPPYLRTHTQDYDIYAKRPYKEARQTEKGLDKMMGFNAFATEPAIHPGTYRVRSRMDGQVYADYTKMPKKVPDNRKINGVRYATLKHEEKNRKRAIADPQSKFRHQKDKDALARMKLAQMLPKSKRKRLNTISFINQIMRGKF